MKTNCETHRLSSHLGPGLDSCSCGHSLHILAETTRASIPPRKEAC